MTPVTIDFETYYSYAFSLTKLTTEEYVRSPEFEVIGVSIRIGDGDTTWYPKPLVADALKAIDWSDKIVVAQNTAFDGAIMAWHYGIKPFMWADTLGMSRALFPHEKKHGLAFQAERMGIGEKGTEVENAIGMHYDDFTPEQLRAYGNYCMNDVDLTYELFSLYLSRGFPKKEMQLIDLTLRMFIEPKLVLDPALLTEHLANVQDIRDNLLAKVRDMMLEGADPDFVHAVYTEGNEGITKLLMSNPKFAEVLVKLGVTPPMKISATTGKETFAFAKTDQGLQELLEHPDMMVQTVVSARLGVKSTIEETRTLRFIDMSHRGPMPIPLRYYGAHSGRWSGQDKINLQNLASRGVHGGKLKKAIKAPEGYIIIDCDSAQIEARTLAWLAGQDDLVQAFRDKQDVYKIMASHIYGIPIEEVTTAQRQVGKTVILGAGYGVGHATLQLFLKTTAKVDVDVAEAQRIIDTYRETYPRIPALWKRAQEALRALKYGQEASIDVPGLCRTDSIGITLPSGLHIQYPGLESVETDKGVQWTYTAKGVQTKVYGGLVVENFTQAIARCVVAEQMLRISKQYFVPMMVHDAAAALAPIDQADEARAYVEECMSWTPKWAAGLPLACESGMGASYGDC